MKKFLMKDIGFKDFYDKSKIYGFVVINTINQQVTFKSIYSSDKKIEIDTDGWNGDRAKISNTSEVFLFDSEDEINSLLNQITKDENVIYAICYTDKRYDIKDEKTFEELKSFGNEAHRFFNCKTDFYEAKIDINRFAPYITKFFFEDELKKALVILNFAINVYDDITEEYVNKYKKDVLNAIDMSEIILKRIDNVYIDEKRLDLVENWKKTDMFVKYNEFLEKYFKIVNIANEFSFK